MRGPVDRGALVATRAEEWIGVPYVDQGRIRAGCDCKGLVAGIAAELGFPEGRSIEALAGDYGRVIPERRLRGGLARLFDRVPLYDRLPGDLLLVRTGGKAQHLAIFAPRSGAGGIRVIEALHRGPMQVRQYRRRPDEIDSVWRWRALAVDGAAHG